MSLVHPTPVTFPGPAGSLEGLYGPPEVPDDAPEGTVVQPSAAAVLCHPHPAHGGTMHNTVVYRAAKALRRAGLAVLRFNFRGTEGSEGVHHGKGLEEGDAAAALDHLASLHPDLELWAGGFSFGARTIAGLAPREPRIRRCLFIALPVSVYECGPIVDVRQPSYLLFAGEDDFGTAAALAERFPGLGPHMRVDEIPPTDHFFRNKTPELEARIHTWAERCLDER
jgi:hypothetical protein